MHRKDKNQKKMSIKNDKKTDLGKIKNGNKKVDWPASTYFHFVFRTETKVKKQIINFKSSKKIYIYAYLSKHHKETIHFIEILYETWFLDSNL